MFPARPQIQNHSFQLGQSMIELIATIAIGTVLILALVALSVRSNSASDFSKAQSQAAGLASEGLEIINSIKASSESDTIRYSSSSCSSGVGPSMNWLGLFAYDIIYCPTYGRPGRLYTPTDLMRPCSAANTWCLDLSGTGMEPITLEGRVFYRTVYVADSSGVSSCDPSSTDYSFIKQFTVVVSWTDSSGSHNSITTSCIRKL